MRSGVLPVVLVLAAMVSAVAAGPASATTWGAPIALPAVTPWTYPGPVVANARGDAIAVSTAGGSYGEPFTVRIDSIVRGLAGAPVFMPGWQLIDTAADDRGMRLLVHQERRLGSWDGRLALLRIAFGARRPAVQPRWAVPRAAPLGAVAVTSSGTTVVWEPRSGALRQVNIDRVWHVRGARPVPVPAVDPQREIGVAGVDLASNGHGGTILAAATLHTLAARRDGLLVLAEAPPRAAFIVRQRVPGVTGRPELLRGPSGRTALLVRDDGGINGGDCGGTGYPRRLWSSVREPTSRRFRTPRQLLEDRRVCYVPGERLTGGPGGDFAVAWGVGESNDSSRATAWASTSAPGAGFTQPQVLANDLWFTGAAYGAGGTLSIAGFRGGANDQDPGRPLEILVQRRAPGGPVGPFAPVPSAADAARAVNGLAEHPALLLAGTGGLLQIQLGRN